MHIWQRQTQCALYKGISLEGETEIRMYIEEQEVSVYHWAGLRDRQPLGGQWQVHILQLRQPKWRWERVAFSARQWNCRSQFYMTRQRFVNASQGRKCLSA